MTTSSADVHPPPRPASEAVIDDALARVRPERVVEITRALCAVRSPDGTEGPRAEVIAALLDRPGIEVEIDPVLPGRPNVIATVRGKGSGPGLLLNGHTDAVPYRADAWSRDPHEPWVEDGVIHGAAVTDMLGAIASMIAAVEVAADIEMPGDLVLLASMYHDTIGLGVKFALSGEEQWPRFGICGEPSQMEIHTGNGGVAKFEVEFSGRTAHVSRIEESADALAAAVDFARALRDVKLDHEPHPRLTDLPRMLVGMVQGGDSPSGVAERAVVSGDIRTVPGMGRRALREQLERVAHSACPSGVTPSLRFTAVQRAFIGPVAGPLVDALSSAHRRVVQREPVVTSRLPGQAFATDAADMQALGVETVVYGPCDWHVVPDEAVPISELVDASRVYLATALTLGTT